MANTRLSPTTTRSAAPAARPGMRPTTGPKPAPVGTVRAGGFAGALAAAQRAGAAAPAGRPTPVGRAGLPVASAGLPVASAAPGPIPGVTGGPAALRLPGDLGGLVAEAAGRYGVDQALIAAVIETESSFNPNAVSPAGATGLMQLMPGTARGLGVADARDPRQNVLGGAKLLGQLLDKYGGDVKKALAAYNAGPGAVDTYGGIPPYAETQRYVPKVLAAYERFRVQ